MSGARYDEVADFYAAGWVDQYDEPSTRSLLAAIGDVSGKRVLDVACGQGRISRELARRGAQVVGVDISRSMLAKALEAEQRTSLDVTYVEADVSAPHPAAWAAGGFDLAICCFGLSDVDDLGGALATITGALRPGGAFVFSILHPCFPGDGGVSGSWPSTADYLAEGWWLADGASSSLRAKVGANHRTLSTYVTSLHRAGLSIVALDEPPPPSAWKAAHAGAARYPVFLVARCQLVSRHPDV